MRGLLFGVLWPLRWEAEVDIGKDPTCSSARETVNGYTPALVWSICWYDPGTLEEREKAIYLSMEALKLEPEAFLCANQVLPGESWSLFARREVSR